MYVLVSFVFIFISHVNRCKIFVEIRLKESERQEGMLFIKISKNLVQFIVRVNRLKNMIVENLKKEEKLIMIIHAQSKPHLCVLGVIPLLCEL